MFVHGSSVYLPRGINVNAPGADGRRPDAAAGQVTEIGFSGRSRFDSFSVNLNYARPAQRIFVAANYTLARAIDDSDGAFGLPASSGDLAAERGPAANDARHRFMSLANVPLPAGLRLGTSLRLQSALPYNITTGRDDNGDAASNDRPPGVTRNTARGRGRVDLGVRLSRAFGFGPRQTSSPGGPQIRVIRGDNPDPLGGMIGEPAVRRYGLELYAQAYNLTNHLNATSFSGVLTSPFFGQATSAGPARHVELGLRLTF